jgi:hypothetical protein
MESLHTLLFVGFVLLSAVVHYGGMVHGGIFWESTNRQPMSLFGGNGYNTDNNNNIKGLILESTIRQPMDSSSPVDPLLVNGLSTGNNNKVWKATNEKDAYNEEDSHEFEMFPRFGKNNNQQLSYALYDPDSNTRLHFNHGTMRRHKVPPPGADTRYKYETHRRPTMTAKISVEHEEFNERGITVRRPYQFTWFGYGPSGNEDLAYFMTPTTRRELPSPTTTTRPTWSGTTPNNVNNQQTLRTDVSVASSVADSDSDGATTPKMTMMTTTQPTAPPPVRPAGAVYTPQRTVDGDSGGDGVGGDGKMTPSPAAAEAAETPERQQLTREEQRRRWYRHHHGRDLPSSAEIEASLRRLSPESPVGRWNGGGQQQQSAAVLAY